MAVENASKTYIDPSLDGDVGDGTEGNPYGDVRYGLGDFTFDTVNGHIIYVKAGTTENDTDIPIVCTPTNSKRLNFRKWGTGNNPKFNGMGASTAIFDHWGGANSQKQYITFEDIAFFNSAVELVNSYGQMGFFRCEFYIAAGGVLFTSSSTGEASECYFHNISGIGVSGGGFTSNCFFKNETNKFTNTISLGPLEHYATRNIMLLDAGSIGIFDGAVSFVINNSILSVGGTGKGMSITVNGNRRVNLSNIVEGFNGTGGYGYYGWAYDNYRWEKNAAYNNTTDYSVSDRLVIGSLDDPDDNENLTESCFAKEGTLVSAPLDFNDPGFWAQVYEYFALKDVGNVMSGAHPIHSGLSKGAIQAAGSGGTPVSPSSVFVSG